MKVSEFKTPDTRWVQSVESEGFQGLAELARDAAEYIPSVSAFGADEIIQRPYFQGATNYEKNSIKRALSDDINWVYTEGSIDDGLFSGEESVRTVAGQALSRFVLSGALGDAILTQKPELEQRCAPFADSYVKQAVLVGGAALHARSEASESVVGGGLFTSVYDEGRLMWQTRTSGTIHGDFGAERVSRPIYGVTDTIWGMIEHPFAPALSEESVVAYHDTETGITRALLHQLVANGGHDPAALRERLVTELSGRTFKAGAAVGDYGVNDGSHQARMLAHTLKRGNLQTEGTIFRTIVDPSYQDYSFEVVLTPQGALLANKNEGVERGSMLIENQDIEPFIIAMTTGGRGRTAPSAILSVVDGLLAANKIGR